MRYEYSDTTQLSPHFNVSEFRCKCGREHEILINPELVSKLEMLYTALDCSRITINSGHRCSYHDKNVGGTGTGQHVNGNAADIVCYGQDGQPISSKIVCCAAQDIGFGGIANITSRYTSTHVDVREGRKWYGNEVISNHTVTDDFHLYYGIPSTTITSGSAVDNHKEGDSMKGIDVSVHNGSIDWNRVKSSGIQFAILRAGYGNSAEQRDKQFEHNYTGAKLAGIPVGAYWYSYAKTPDEARQEAQVCISVLMGKQFEFPVYFDLEQKETLDTGKANCSAMVRAFCDELERAGYWVGLYASRSVLDTHIEEDIKSRYALWIAEWGGQMSYGGSVGIWQYSDKGRVNGINGNVDLDEAFIDYTGKVMANGLNGFNVVNAAETVAAPMPIEVPFPAGVNDSAAVVIQVGDDIYKGTLTKV